MTRLILILICMLTWPSLARSESAFPGSNFEPLEASLNTLWLKAELKKQILDSFGYSLPGIRLRYWRSENRSAWVLHEVGKEQPITFGIIISEGKIEQIDVLEYRETRGGEIQYPFFRKQFLGSSLAQKGEQYRLNQSIDGITGATLSVNAMKKVAKVALFLHKHALSS